jgi:hypothetical protein
VLGIFQEVPNHYYIQKLDLTVHSGTSSKWREPFLDLRFCHGGWPSKKSNL